SVASSLIVLSCCQSPERHVILRAASNRGFREDSLQNFMKRLLLTGAVIALYVLHQDFWFWRTPSPLVLGFLPVGLFYHLVYTLAVAALMWLLVKYVWPSHLETEAANTQSASRQFGRNPQSGGLE